MHHQVLVRISNSRAHALKQLQFFVDCQAALIAVHVYRHALDKLHDEIGRAVVGRPAIDQAGDVGMIEHGQDLALTAKSLKDVIGIQSAADDFDGDELMKRVVRAGGQVYGSHSTAADLSNDIRRVAYQLHPSILEHLGLGVALRSYCSEFASREGIEVILTADKAPATIPEDVSLCLYRVIQESLRNIVKHSSAKKVTVKLESIDSRVHLAISDNGVGFDPATPQRTGIGLLSMRERVRLVDGEILVKSESGKGTKIDIWAPLPKTKP